MSIVYDSSLIKDLLKIGSDFEDKYLKPVKKIAQAVDLVDLVKNLDITFSKIYRDCLSTLNQRFNQDAKEKLGLMQQAQACLDAIKHSAYSSKSTMSEADKQNIVINAQQITQVVNGPLSQIVKTKVDEATITNFNLTINNLINAAQSKTSTEQASQGDAQMSATLGRVLLNRLMLEVNEPKEETKFTRKDEQGNPKEYTASSIPLTTKDVSSLEGFLRYSSNTKSSDGLPVVTLEDANVGGKGLIGVSEQDTSKYVQYKSYYVRKDALAQFFVELRDRAKTVKDAVLINFLRKLESSLKSELNLDIPADTKTTSDPNVQGDLPDTEEVDSISNPMVMTDMNSGPIPILVLHLKSMDNFEKFVSTLKITDDTGTARKITRPDICNSILKWLETRANNKLNSLQEDKNKNTKYLSLVTNLLKQCPVPAPGAGSTPGVGGIQGQKQDDKNKDDKGSGGGGEAIIQNLMGNDSNWPLVQGTINLNRIKKFYTDVYPVYAKEAPQSTLPSTVQSAQLAVQQIEKLVQAYPVIFSTAQIPLSQLSYGRLLELVTNAHSPTNLTIFNQAGEILHTLMAVLNTVNTHISYLGQVFDVNQKNKNMALQRALYENQYTFLEQNASSLMSYTFEVMRKNDNRK